MTFMRWHNSCTLLSVIGQRMGRRDGTVSWETSVHMYAMYKMDGVTEWKVHSGPECTALEAELC